MPRVHLLRRGGAENADPSRGWAFIVDPIDGTTNFVRGLRQSAISVALARDGQVEYAVVFDPYKNEMFSARRGGGGFLNGAPIHVSGKAPGGGDLRMGTAIYCRSTWSPPCARHGAALPPCLRLPPPGGGGPGPVRRGLRAGGAVLRVQPVPWDFAAGSLIITEAGGHISTLQGGPLALTERCSVWASNDVNKDILRELEI